MPLRVFIYTQANGLVLQKPAPLPLKGVILPALMKGAVTAGGWRSAEHGLIHGKLMFHLETPPPPKKHLKYTASLVTEASYDSHNLQLFLWLENSASNFTLQVLHMLQALDGYAFEARCYWKEDHTYEDLFTLLCQLHIKNHLRMER